MKRGGQILLGNQSTVFWMKEIPRNSVYISCSWSNAHMLLLLYNCWGVSCNSDMKHFVQYTEANVTWVESYSIILHAHIAKFLGISLYELN